MHNCKKFSVDILNDFSTFPSLSAMLVLVWHSLKPDVSKTQENIFDSFVRKWTVTVMYPSMAELDHMSLMREMRFMLKLQPFTANVMLSH